jgi:hypothetical protein
MSGSIPPIVYTGMVVQPDGFKTVIEFDQNTALGVYGFNGRVGLVTLSSADVTGALGYTPANNTAISGFTARLVSVGLSPFTYTAGSSVEYVNLYGGTVSSCTINGVVIANASPCFFALAPGQSVAITYSSPPTMAVNKH